MTQRGCWTANGDIADVSLAASSPAHARLHEIEGAVFENCRISKGISQARALQGDRGTEPFPRPSVEVAKPRVGDRSHHILST